ncbi:hypothetical protein AwErysi_05360 [Erysipelotrichaceae bacterium]|nr:hypothetical protein AwErysi_05360 [Erysipelotrichaceae bacterium]
MRKYGRRSDYLSMLLYENQLDITKLGVRILHPDLTFSEYGMSYFWIQTVLVILFMYLKKTVEEVGQISYDNGWLLVNGANSRKTLKRYWIFCKNHFQI